MPIPQELKLALEAGCSETGFWRKYFVTLWIYDRVVTNSRQQQVTSIYSVTQRRRCYAMQEKYGWRLLRIKPTKDSILKYSCILECETSFPNYMDEDEED